jgi:hypothetical protein
MNLAQATISNALFHVVRNMGWITVKPEQEPELLAERRGLMCLAWVSVVWGGLIRMGVGNAPVRGMAQ